MNIRFAPNTLYYGDCLDIMRDFPNNCVDLICLDPPFNSNANYHAIFRGSGLSIKPQIKAFDDMWLWDTDSAARVAEIKNAIANPASKVIAGFEQFIPQTPMLSYVSYMAQRLFEMRRVLKETGSIYLHCDPTASHYLKLVMDAIFGQNQFRNEIVWHYQAGTKPANAFGRKHDTLFYYNKSREWIHNRQSQPVQNPERYTETDNDGRKFLWGGNWDKTLKRGTIKYYLDDGKACDDVWTWINEPQFNSLNSQSKERLGYPTQKPLALYERIIKASSNPGDIVLDPFAGCGTTIEAARKNNRRAVGIDILPFALRLINRYRLIPNGINPMNRQGVPVDYETAADLAKSNPYQFQDWAISLIDGLASNPQKSGDEGIDGFGMFEHTPTNMEKKAIVVQVTGASGSQLAKYERLQTTIRNTNAAMGILITLDAQPSRNWTHTLDPVIMGETRFASIQCFSIQEYYRNNERWNQILNLPPLANPWTGRPMQKMLFEE